METRNVLIGVVVLLVVLGLGYWFLNSVPAAAPGQNATTTPPVASGDNTPPTPALSPAKPGVQTGPLAVTSNTSAVVTGYVAPNGSPTTYWYDYGTTNALSSRGALQSVGSGFVTLATPTFLSGLSSNTTYYYRLSAQNGFGATQGAVYSFTTTANPPAQGSAPSAATLVAANITRTAATMSGSVNPNNSPTTYWFEYGPTQGFGSVSAFGSAGDGAASLAVSASASSLDPQTTYYYRVVAQNQYGTTRGATQSFVTLGPATTGLPTVDTTAATNVATSSATLNGRINPRNAASSYWFEYGTNSLLIDILGTASATQTLPADATTAVSANIAGLSTNTKYYYRVVARNPQGTVRGDIVSFTTRR